MTAPDYAERARELLEGVVIGLDAPRFSDRIELRRALADRIAHALAQAAEEGIERAAKHAGSLGVAARIAGGMMNLRDLAAEIRALLKPTAKEKKEV